MTTSRTTVADTALVLLELGINGRDVLETVLTVLRIDFMGTAVSTSKGKTVSAEVKTTQRFAASTGT